MEHRWITAAGMLLLLLVPASVSAHCDAVDGPVATAAVKALEAKNINLVLPYVRPEAEAEMTAAFERVSAVRTQGADAKALADRFFMETAVRLHRAGENAPYTGLKPAGTDFGPAIRNAEQSLQTGKLEPVLSLLSHEIARHVTERFHHAAAARIAPAAPTTRADVEAVRRRVTAELEFVGYVEGLWRSIKGGGGHAE